MPSGRMLGMALRMSTELVAAVVVGAGMGWLLDQWLGTMPLFLLVFLLLGMAAGFRNVIRTATEMGSNSGSGPDTK